MRRKKVRVFQQARDVRRHGKRHAPWYISYFPHDQRRKVERIGDRNEAHDRAAELELELNRGTYRHITPIPWPNFVAEYQRLHLDPNVRGTSNRHAIGSLEHFHRICQPTTVDRITQADIDEFCAARLMEPGNRKGSRLSPNTLHTNLTDIKAALKWAHGRKYLAELPTFRNYSIDTMHHAMSIEDFSRIYRCAWAANQPAYDGQLYTTKQFWQSVLMFAFTTGWRRSQIFSLRWRDIDLDSGEITAVGTHEGNKGGRNERFVLPEATLAHVKALWHSGDRVFWWQADARGLYDELARIQDEAGIDLPCLDSREHQCSRSCHRYGFHSVRRAFATENEANMTPRELQVMMQHRDFSTTLRYIEDAGRMQRKRDIAERIVIPE